MKSITEGRTRKGLSKLNTDIRVLTGRLKRRYPHLTFDILEKEIIDRLKSINHCELSGMAISCLSHTDIILVRSKSDIDSVHVNNVLIVHQRTADLWNELESLIDTSPDFSHLSDLAAKLLLVQNTVRSKVNSLKLTKNAADVSVIIEKSTIQPERIIQLRKLKDPDFLASLKIPVFNSAEFINRQSFYSGRAIQRKINALKERSFQKGLSCDLTMRNTADLFFIKHCQLTGLPLVKSTKNQTRNHFGFSFDRINRFEGYNVDNILIVAHEVNIIKSAIERNNYSESIDNIRQILQETKDIMLKRHAHDNLKNRIQPLSIDSIIEQYLNKPNDFKRFVF